MSAAQPQKRASSVRITEETWQLIDKVARTEGWSRNITIQEMVKFYARQNNISISEKEAGHEND